jgi:GT2 family glycosyltransferase
MKTAIIVLNWQRWQDTLMCLMSLKNLTFSPSSLIICDNDSHNESFAQILAWAQKHYVHGDIAVFEQPPIYTEKTKSYPLVLIQTGKNLGFAGGNNVGIRYALNCKEFNYIWILNNDTEVDKNALSALIKCSENSPTVGLWGSTIIDFFDRETVQCAGGCRYFPIWTIFKPVFGGQSLKSLENQLTNKIRLDYISGASLFLKTEVLERVGLLNEEYFLFYEELDYAQRLKKHGYDMAWCSKSLVYHKNSASVGSVREGNREKLKRANYYENLSTLKYTKNFHPYLLAFVIIFRFIFKALALIRRGDFFLFPPLFQAYYDFFTTP